MTVDTAVESVKRNSEKYLTGEVSGLECTSHRPADEAREEIRL